MHMAAMDVDVNMALLVMADTVMVRMAPMCHVKMVHICVTRYAPFLC